MSILDVSYETLCNFISTVKERDCNEHIGHIWNQEWADFWNKIENHG